MIAPVLSTDLRMQRIRVCCYPLEGLFHPGCTIKKNLRILQQCPIRGQVTLRLERVFALNEQGGETKQWQCISWGLAYEIDAAAHIYYVKLSRAKQNRWGYLKQIRKGI